MPTYSAETSRALPMRHSCRQKHLKHAHRSAHIRRMCYFRASQIEKANAEEKQRADMTEQAATDISSQAVETS